MTASTIRSRAIAAAVWAIIIGTIYLTLSILAILIYNESFTIENPNKLNFMLKLIYFTDQKGPVDLSKLDENLVNINAEFTVPPFTSTRTFGWMIAYAVLSSLWILTSFILMVGAVVQDPTIGIYRSVAPWGLATSMNLFADIVAVITYAIDIPNMLNLKETIKFIGLNVSVEQDVVNIDELLEQYEYTWIPGAIMLIFFSRAAVFWIVNIITLISVIQEANQTIKKANNTTETTNNNNNNNQIQVRNGQSTGSWLTPKAEMSYRTEISPSLKADMKRAYSSYQNEDQQYPQSSTPQMSRLNSFPSQQDDNMSVLRKEFEQRVQQQQKRQGPAELRGQLPWSYFNEAGVSPLPRPSSQEKDLRPPVPVPDYTLHFPKRRPNSEEQQMKSSSQKPNNSSYEYDGYRNGGYQNPAYSKNMR